MSKRARRSSSPPPLATSLWQALTTRLQPRIDPQQVAAAAVQTIAEATGSVTLLLWREGAGSHYAVSLAQPGRPPTLHHWPAATDLTHTLSTAGVVNGPQLPLAADLTPAGTAWLVAPLPPSPAPWTPAHLQGGLVVAQPTVAAAFGPAEVMGWAGVVGVFMERAGLLHDAVRRQIMADVVQDISNQLTSKLSLEEIIETVSNPVRRILNAQTVSIGLVEEETGAIVFVPALLGPLFHGLPPLRLAPGEGIAGWVAQRGEPVLSNDVYNDARFYTRSDEQSGFRTDSMLCVPLRLEDRVIGVLEAINKRPGLFDDQDLRLLQAIASPLAIALENARLHAAVVSEKRRMETIFARMSEGIVTVDEEGRITAANDGFLTLLQTSLAQVTGQPLAQVVRTRPAHLLTYLMQPAAIEHSQTVACDLYSLATPSQATPALISSAHILDDSGAISETVLVFSDLRPIRELERMRDDFFHNIVHELRTPLTTILMYARLLRTRRPVADPARQERFLGIIEKEADRLQNMVRQMLAISRLEAHQIQRSATRVNLNQILEDVLARLSEQARDKGLALTTSIPPDLPLIPGDGELLHTVFKNLVENAIKFTPAGQITLVVWLEKDTIHIAIQDEGIGIPQEALPNLFRRFYRTQTAVERGIAGAGLGLYIVKEGVKKHGGVIEVTSHLDLGTTFLVQLPVNGAAEAQSDTPVNVDQQPLLSS